MAQPRASTPAERPWHAVPPERTLEELGSRCEGLDDREASERWERFGPNVLPRRKRAGLVRVLLRQFKDPLIYIVLVAGAVSLAIGSQGNAGFIFAVLALNAGIGAFQEWRAESSANPLLIAAVVAAHGIHIAALWTPGLSEVLGVEPVSPTTWLALLPIAASLLLFDEASKWLRSSRARRNPRGR